MIEFTCAHCTQVMRVQDSNAGKMWKCKRCSQMTIIPRAGPRRPPLSAKSIIYRVLAGLACFVVIIFAMAVSQLEEESKPSPTPAAVPAPDVDRNSTMAVIMSEKFVKERLISPSTAKFPGLFNRSDKARAVSDTEYRVSSYFDSQNRFGAMIRSEYSCTMIRVGDDAWRCTDLEITER